MSREGEGLVERIVRAFVAGPLSPLLLIVTAAAGAVAVLATPREEEPQIVVPMADVFVSFPGASAEEVEKLVATPLEKLLWQVEGVEHVYSISRRDGAVVTVRFFVGEDRERALILGMFPDCGLENVYSVGNAAGDGARLALTERGTEVRAPYAGRVVYSDWPPGLGLLLIIDHGGGYMTLYGHNEQLYKTVGEGVDAGEVIATVGDSGGQARPGLYIEVRQGTTAQDPRRWFRGSGP